MVRRLPPRTARQLPQMPETGRGHHPRLSSASSSVVRPWPPCASEHGSSAMLASWTASCPRTEHHTTIAHQSRRALYQSGAGSGEVCRSLQSLTFPRFPLGVFGGKLRHRLWTLPPLRNALQKDRECCNGHQTQNDVIRLLLWTGTGHHVAERLPSVGVEGAYLPILPTNLAAADLQEACGHPQQQKHFL